MKGQGLAGKPNGSLTPPKSNSSTDIQGKFCLQDSAAIITAIMHKTHHHSF